MTIDVQNILNINATLERIPPPFPYLKHLLAIDPSFLTITKLSSNEIRETFCGGLK